MRGRFGYAAGMRIEFLKMQGLGNDFLVFDAPASDGGPRLDSTLLRALADRHTGIGFDQALMLERPREASSRAYYRIFNADGSEVEQCGNGARCVAALLYARAPELGRELTLGSPGGVVHARVGDDGQVAVDMGLPRFTPASLPFEAPREQLKYPLDLGGTALEIGAVSIGNPHVVTQVENVDTAAVRELGPRVETHPRFPKRVNVGFMQVVARDHIRLRVHERGAGETQACGTGACAAVVMGRRWGLLDETVRVDLPGGTASVSWHGFDQHVWLTGPATTVYSGSVDLTNFKGAKQ
jgi:diaminopimelate epimerase